MDRQYLRAAAPSRFRSRQLAVPSNFFCRLLSRADSTALKSEVKRPGFPEGEPESLYRRDSPWISSYHIQNSFQTVN